MQGLLIDYGETLVEIRQPDLALDAAYVRIAQRLAAEPRVGPLPPPARLRAGVHDLVQVVVAAHAERCAMEEIDLVPIYRNAYGDLLGTAPGPNLLHELIGIEQRAWFAGVRPVAGAQQALTALRAAGLRLGICSNAPYLASTLHEQIAHLGLTPLLDSITLSGEVGWRKPSPRLFKHAVESLGIDRSGVVMVGDRLREDVEGARSAGLRAVWVRPRGARQNAEVAGADAVIDGLIDLLPLLGL